MKNTNEIAFIDSMRNAAGADCISVLIEKDRPLPIDIEVANDAYVNTKDEIERREHEQSYLDHVENVTFDYGGDLQAMLDDATDNLKLAALCDLKSDYVDRGDYLNQNPDVINAITKLILRSSKESKNDELVKTVCEIYFLLTKTLKEYYKGPITAEIENCRNQNISLLGEDDYMKSQAEIFAERNCLTPYDEYAVRPVDFFQY